MNVGELIKELEKYDKEKKVLIDDSKIIWCIEKIYFDEFGDIVIIT